MTRALPESLLGVINTLDDARGWIETLHQHDLAFHFDDSPETIIDKNGRRLFSDADAAAIKMRVAALYQFDWGVHDCPIGYLMHVERIPRFESDAEWSDDEAHGYALFWAGIEYPSFDNAAQHGWQIAYARAYGMGVKAATASPRTMLEDNPWATPQANYAWREGYTEAAKL